MDNKKQIKEIISYIEKNLDKELSVEQVARKFNYSKFYIIRLFKNNVGCTLYKYIQSRRLTEAAKKLVDTNKTIVEIALEAGYSSQQAFTQAFRCEYIYTPQEYRKLGIFMPKRSKIDMKYELEGRCAA